MHSPIPSEDPASHSTTKPPKTLTTKTSTIETNTPPLHINGSSSDSEEKSTVSFQIPVTEKSSNPSSPSSSHPPEPSPTRVSPRHKPPHNRARRAQSDGSENNINDGFEVVRSSFNSCTDEPFSSRYYADTSLNDDSSVGTNNSTSSSGVNSLFQSLLKRVERGIDEMYYHCEANITEEGVGYIERVRGVLLRGGRDFEELGKRIGVQSSLALNSSKTPTAVSWEVRKNTSGRTASGGSSSDLLSSSIIRSSIERMEKDAAEQRETHEKHLSSTTNETETEAMSSTLAKDKDKAKLLPKDNAWSRKLSFTEPPILKNQSPSTEPNPFINTNADTSNKAKTKPILLSRSNSFDNTSQKSKQHHHQSKQPHPADLNLVITGRQLSIPALYVDEHFDPIPGLPPPPNQSSTPTNENEDKAIENVWAEAEAWLDNISKAEDEAWIEMNAGESESMTAAKVDTIQEVNEDENEDNDDDDDIRERTISETNSHSSSSSPQSSFMAKLRARTPEMQLAMTVKTSSTSSSTKKRVDKLVKKLNAEEQSEDDASYNVKRATIPKRDFLTKKQSWYSSSEDEDDDSSSLSIARKTTPAKQQIIISPLSSSSATTTTPTTPYTHYSLHDKLSSPERRRPSPAETKAKMDERASAAAQRRLEQDKASRLKLAKAAEKIERAKNSIEMKDQQRAANLSEKMRLAEEQAYRHLQTIVKKAGIENTKVDEISSINALNARDFEDQLSLKLLDTEKRIDEARERRSIAQAQTGIKNEKKRVQSAKVMSERELEKEKQQHVRWEAMQVRIKAVDERREARIKEAERLAQLKKDKMEEAVSRRSAMEDAVIQRSAEKEQRRAKVLARRSGDFSDDDSDTSPSNRDLTERDSFEFAAELIPAIALSPLPGAPLRQPDRDSRRSDKQQDKAKEKKHAGTPTPAPNNASVSTALKLLAHLDFATQDLSREDKKKRRKRVTAARKKLAEEVPHAIDKDVDDRVPLSSKLLSAVSRVDEAVKGLPMSSSEESFAPNSSSMMESKSLDYEILSLAKVFDRLVTDDASNSNPSLCFVVSSVVKCLVRAHKALVQINHRLYYSTNLSTIASSLLSILSSSPNSYGVYALLFCADGAACVVDSAIRAVGHEAYNRMLETAGCSIVNRGGVDGRGSIRLLTDLLVFAPEVDVGGDDDDVRNRQMDIMRYLVLTPLCDTLCAMLRSVNTNSNSNSIKKNSNNNSSNNNASALGRNQYSVNFISQSALPLIDCLSRFFENRRSKEKKEKTETIVLTFEELCFVDLDPSAIALKHSLLERVGGGLISLVASVLPLANNPNSFDVCREFAGLSSLALHSLINIGKLDLRRFQILCKGDPMGGSLGWEGGGGYLEFNYVCGVVLGGVDNLVGESQGSSSTADFDACVKNCIILIGYYCLGNPNNQQRLHWGEGGSITLLGRLSQLPFKFFSDPIQKDVLFPTLLAACYENDTNRDAVEKEVNMGVISEYMKEVMKLDGEDGRKKQVEVSSRIPRVPFWEGAGFGF